MVPLKAEHPLKDRSPDISFPLTMELALSSVRAIHQAQVLLCGLPLYCFLSEKVTLGTRTWDSLPFWRVGVKLSFSPGHRRWVPGCPARLCPGSTQVNPGLAAQPGM